MGSHASNGRLIDLSQYRGVNQFGRAYQVMLENDAHAPGSVDRVLMGRMIRLVPETVAYLYGEYTPTRVKYQKGSRPKLERCVEEAIAGRSSDEEQIAGIAQFCVNMGKAVSDDLDAMQMGGTEEEIICRGSDWCTDVARVGCVLYQIVGFSARLVYLADTAQAYSGHVIVEVYREEVWGAVDPTTAVIYRHPNGKPVTTWELMHQPELVQAYESPQAYYTSVSQFRSAAVVNYFVWDWKDYDYTVSPLNDYYRSILRMSMKGWPGGLRWLHGEDQC